METTFTGTSKITLDHVELAKTSTLNRVEFKLELDEKLDDKRYYDSNGKMTFDGTKALTQCFIQGLLANITNSNNEGVWKAADHLNYVINEIDKRITASGEFDTETFKK